MSNTFKSSNRSEHTDLGLAKTDDEVKFELRSSIRTVADASRTGAQSICDSIVLYLKHYSISSAQNSVSCQKPGAARESSTPSSCEAPCWGKLDSVDPLGGSVDQVLSLRAPRILTRGQAYWSQERMLMTSISKVCSILIDSGSSCNYVRRFFLEYSQQYADAPQAQKGNKITFYQRQDPTSLCPKFL